MSNTLEHEVRVALKERAASLRPEVLERLARIDYLPPSRQRPRWLVSRRQWPAGGAALAAGTLAAILLVSSGAPVAYAGWTPTPTKPTPAAVAATAAACNREGSRLSGQPVLTDARGKYTALIYVSGDRAHDCISDGSPDHSSSGFDNLRLKAPPGPDQLGLPASYGASAPGFFRSVHPNQPLPPQFQRLLQQVHNPTLRAMREATFRSMVDSGTASRLYGPAGSHISSVTFTFANGVAVDATVQHGWYFAWWPSFDYPTSVRVTTKSGATITSPMPSRGCRPGTSCSLFAGLRLHPY